MQPKFLRDMREEADREEREKREKVIEGVVEEGEETSG